MKEYVVISPGEGDVSVEAITKEELEKRLAENYYGMSAGPLEDSDATRWHRLVIIKGEVVVPTAVIGWKLP